MVKRRRGARTARPRHRRHRPFEELVERARSPRSRSRSRAPSTRSPSSSPTSRRRPAPRERDRPGRDPVRPVRGRPADRVGRRLGADPEPDHALPAAARGGLRGSGRPRRRGLGDGHPRARPPPRHRRRPARRARHRLRSRVSRPGSPARPARPIAPTMKPIRIGSVSQRNATAGPPAPPDRDRHPAGRGRARSSRGSARRT